MIDETQLAKYGPEGIPDPRSVFAFRVTDPITEELAVKFASVLQSEIKGFEAGKEEVVTPTYRAYVQGRTWFDDRIKPRKAAREHLRSEIEAYRARKRADVQRSLQAATSHEEIREAVESVVTKPEGLSEREEWHFVITDPSLLPRQFLIPDQKALDAYAEANKRTTNIPGGMAVSRKVPILRAT